MGTVDQDQPASLEKREGGRGNLARILEELSDPHRARGTAGMLASAIRNGLLDLFSIDYGTARREATILAKSDEPRLKAAGVKLLEAMAGHDLKMVEAIDKAARLDVGSATEHHEHRVQFIKGVDPDRI